MENISTFKGSSGISKHDKLSNRDLASGHPASAINNDSGVAGASVKDALNNVIKKSSDAVSGNIPTWLDSSGDELGSGYPVDLTITAGSTGIPRSSAVKAYADSLVVQGGLVYKGVIDCSLNPNYPSADKGHVYVISVAGKIGGASGVNVEVNDQLLCKVDGSPSGDQATVGSNWNIIQANIDGAVIGPVSSTSGNIATFNGAAGKLIQDSGLNINSGEISTIKDLVFNITLDNPSHQEGKVFYDKTKHALSYYNDEADVTVNISQEFLIRVKNETGSPILNGRVVYPSGTSGTDVLIDLANCAERDKCRLVGVVTHDIEDGTTGYVTKLGEVGSVDTSAYSSGTLLYLDTASGLLTDVRPTGGSYVTPIAAVKVVDASSGVIVVDVNTSEMTVEQNRGIGWGLTDTATISFTDSSPDRTLTISPTLTQFVFYQAGEKYEKTSDSIQLPDEEGLFLIYYNLGTLTYIKNPTVLQIDTIIRTYPTVAYVYWNADDNKHEYLGNEMHKIGMNAVTHAYLHSVLRCRYLYGLEPSDIVADGNGASNTHAQFGIEYGAIADEDLYYSISDVAYTSGLPIFYLAGTAASPKLRSTTNAGFSVLNSGTADNRLVYNTLSGGNYVLSEVTNGDFVCCHVIAVNSDESSKRVVALIGQAKYATVTLAREGARTEINNVRLSGIIPNEVKAIATFVFQTSNSYSNSVHARIRSIDTGVNYVDWREVQIAGSSVSAVTVPIFNDSTFQIYDDGDPTKTFQFQASGVTTGTNRVFSVPDASGTIIVSEGVGSGQILRGGVTTSGTLSLYNNVSDNQGIVIENDGTITANVSSYESLVTSSNDIPNKKYTDIRAVAMAIALG